MGIHDRDYYRDDSGRWGCASAHRGVILLIAVTVALSLMNLGVTEQTFITNDEGVRVGVTEVHPLSDVLQFDYAKVVGEYQLWRPFTSFLLTPNWLLGLIFGMLLLYFFGGEMEILYGTGRFLAFYLLAGVLANVVKLVLGVAGATAPTYGTAAPMFATMVLFAFHYPHKPIRIWFLIPIPVWILVSIYLGLNLLMLLGAVAARNPEALPHVMEPLVGAAVGFAYYRTRGRLFAFVDMIGGLFRRRESSRRSPANLRVYDETAPRPSTRAASPTPAKPEPVPQPAGGGVDEHLEAKLDAVLAKVARHGKGSLTAEENDILMRASEVFKKKRR
jgi:membrane associated rhomboid family serine protease